MKIFSKIWKLAERSIRWISRLPNTIINSIPGTGRGSKQRNLASVVIGIGSIVMLIDLCFKLEALSPSLIYVAISLTLIHFFIVVMGVLFLTSHNFQVSPTRLARDTAISTAGIILAFSHAYMLHGFSLDAICPKQLDQLDALYFSTVTFSTLGYGDFRPCAGWSRFFAPLQAIIGNLHLALMVGAAFLLASTSNEKK